MIQFCRNVGQALQDRLKLLLPLTLALLTPSVARPQVQFQLRQILTGESASDFFGRSLAATDMNGDGYDDVIVGASGYNDGSFEGSGRIYLYFGGPAADNVADFNRTGPPFDQLGFQLSAGGNFNGDSYPDLIAGAPFSDPVCCIDGTTYIYFGDPSRTGTILGENVEISGPMAQDAMGYSVGFAADLNDDGYDDLILGAPGSQLSSIGHAYVFYGSASPGHFLNTPNLTLTGPSPGSVFGCSVAGVGDVNGDTFPDIIVGATFTSDGGPLPGRAYIFYGGPGMDTVADVRLVGEAAFDAFGHAVSSAGDINNDGKADVIVGAPKNDAGGMDAGRAYIYFGGAAMDSLPDVILTGAAAGDQFGTSVAPLGDLNPGVDGFDEFIVGAPYNDASGADAGRAYVYFGGSPPDTTADRIFSGEAAGDVFGACVNTAGDMTGDGVPDIIVGANGNDAAGSNAGRAYVYEVGPPDWVNVAVGAAADTATGRGLAWGDYDNDGDEDIFVSVWGTNKLLRNDGSAVFSGIAIPASMRSDSGTSNGAAWADFDDDGDLDLYFTNIAGDTNRLIRNDGGGVFVNATTGPLGSSGTCRAAPWVDYDNDGDVDLYLARTGPNELLRNDGAGVFASVAVAPLNDGGTTVVAAWADYDNDGDQDVYVVNSGTANHLLRNDGGTFVEAVTGVVNYNGNSTSADWGDYDNDGDLDLYLAIDFQANKLFRNEGGSTFSDLSSAPLNDAGRALAVSWADYDNDGDLDLFLSRLNESHKLFRNESGGVFVDATTDSIGMGINDYMLSFAWSDFDSDGDLDLYEVRGVDFNEGRPNRLLRNDGFNENHWLQVHLTGVVSNRSAIGARIRVKSGGIWRIREINGGRKSQNSLIASFGLGAAAIADSVEVRWPSGLITRQAMVAVDQKIDLIEPVPLIVPATVPDIQSALDFSEPGDTITVQPGTYTGSRNRNLVIPDRNLLIVAPAGPESTIIDCADSGRAFVFSAGSSSRTVLGFTVINGLSTSSGSAPSPGPGLLAPPGSGGAVAIVNTSPAFVNCVFAGNHAQGSGGAVSITNGAAAFTDCRFTGNAADMDGGAIFCEGTATPTFTRCTIAANAATGSGGGIELDTGVSVSFVRTVVYGNCAFPGGEVNAVAGTTASFSCSDVDSSGVDGPGTVNYIGNTFFTNPRFCAPITCAAAPDTGGTFTLALDSPCLASASLCSLQVGVLGSGCPTVSNVWTGEGDATSWQDDANWSGGQPADGDDVLIPDVAATSEVVYSSGTRTIGVLDCSEDLRINEGTLSIQGTSPVNAKLTVEPGGTLAGLGAVTVSDSVIWRGGTVTGTGTIIAAGNMSLEGPADKILRGGRVLRNPGAVTWSGQGDLRHGDGDLGTRIENQTGATWTSPGRRSLTHITPGGGTPALFVNQGTLSETADSTLTVEMDVNNTGGTIDIPTGRVDLRRGFTNFSGTTLSGGSYLVTGTLRFPGANVVTNAAAVVLNGTTSGIRDTSNAPGLTNYAANTSAGSLTLTGGRTITTSGAFTNAGALIVAATSSFAATGSYTQTGGITTVQSANSTVTAASFDIQGGSVTGIGGLGSPGVNFVNSGILRPGSSPGRLSISGNYQQTSTGELEIEIGGYTAGSQFDVVDVAGTATLDGKLRIELVNGFDPVPTNTFTFFNASSITGNFASLTSFSMEDSVIVATTSRTLYVKSLHPRFSAVSGSSWFTAANWSPAGPPNANQDVLIDTTVVIGAGAALARNIRIADSGAVQGNLQLNGGTLAATSLEVKKNSGGTLTLNSPTSIVTLQSVKLDSSAAVNWYAGSIQVTGGTWTQTERNLNIGLAGGTSVLYLGNGAVATVPGTVYVGAETGSQSTVVVDGSTSTLSAGILTIGNRGTGTVSLLNSGQVQTGYAGEPGAATVVGAFGTLTGVGTILGPVMNGGLVSPGLSAGTLHISGNYIQTAAGTATTEGVLQIEVGNPATNEYDQLAVTGLASLGGTLRIVALNTLPAEAITSPLTIMTFADRGGTRFGKLLTWSSPSGPPSTDSLLVDTTYAATSVTVSSISVTGVASPPPPRRFLVYPNFPNPVRSATTIRFELPAPETVTIRIYDVMGRLVRTLVDHEAFEAGVGERVWDGRSDSRTAVVSGMYFYSVQAGGAVRNRRMIVLR